MKASEVFPSRYLKSADLGSAQPVVTIEDVTMEKLGDEDRMVVTFVGKQKGLVLNKTNLGTLARMFGDETDNWGGQSVKLKVMEVQYKQDLVLAIRISGEKVVAPAKPATATAAARTAKAKPAAAAPAKPDWVPDDEAANAEADAAADDAEAF